MSAASDRLRADQDRMLDDVARTFTVMALRRAATNLHQVGDRVPDLMEDTYAWARVLERRADELEGK